MLKEKLEQFIKLTHCTDIDEASEKLGMPVAEVGAFIATLEEEIGCTLFHKKSKNLELTGYGRVLRARSPHIILELRHLDEALEAERQRYALSIHFGFFATTHAFILMPQIADALTDLLFTTSIQAARNLVSDMKIDHIHIGIMPKTAVPEGFKSVDLLEEQAYLSVPFTSALSAKERLTLDDVVSEPIYMVSDIYGVSQWYERIYTAAGGDLSRAQRPEASEYLLGANATPRNHLSTNVMQMFGNTGAQRVEIPIDDDIARRQIVLAYQEKDAQRLKRVIDFIVDNKEKLYSSTAFTPYLLHPGQRANLVHIDVSA